MAKLEKIENSVAEFKLDITPDKFEEGMKKAYTKNVKYINVPGFRKGKAPRAMIEKMYGAEVFYEDALNFVFGDVYEEAVKELELDVVDQPEITDVSEIKKGENTTLTVKVTVKPEVKLGKYKGIKLEKVEYNVSDEDVDAEISKLQERNSRVVEVEDRAVEKDDIAVIDFEGFKDGVAFAGGSGKDFELTIGSGQFIPGFEDQLIGANKGDDVTVNVTFPEDYHAEDLKGAAVEFKVKVNAIKKKELPALDDEFAKDVSEFDTFEELKNDTKAKLEKQNSDRAKAETEDKAIEAVAEKTEVEIPECMIKNQLENMLRDYDARLQGQGINLQQYFQMTGMTADSFKEQFKDHATKQVKISLTLEAIAKAEKVEASAEDVEAEYNKIAESYQMKAEDIKKFIHEDDIKDGIINRKVVEMIVEQSK